MPRSMWKGAISFGLVYIPVQMFSADKRHELDLTMVDKRDFSPIGYKRYNKSTGKEIEWDNIVKAYEYEADQYVVLTDEDLRRANVKATQTIDILSFTERDQVPALYYEQPYYLTPAKGGEKVYALLREALRRSGKLAIAQVVIRTKQHLVALVPVDDMIVLDTLRYADEIRSREEFELPSLKQAGLTAKEIDMALTLIEGMTEEWDATHYHDTYRDDVMAMVQRKIKAHQTRTLTEPDAEQEPQRKSAKVIDLMALLKQSVNSTGKKPAPRSRAPASKTTAKKSAGKRHARSTPRSKAG